MTYIITITGITCLCTWVWLHGKINRDNKIVNINLIKNKSELWTGKQFIHERNNGINTIYKCKICGDLITEMNLSSSLRREHICIK